ncbi:MAG: PepSY-associated TM helix domain-containing protein [Bryobacteraceae bacterium]
MYRTIRNTHLLLGLFSAAAVFMYGLSSVQFAHQWFNVRPAASAQTLTLAPNAAGARAVAMELMEKHGLEGELVQVRQTPGGVAFRLNRIGKNHGIEYTAATGETKVETQSAGVMAMMVRLHHINGLWHEIGWINVAAGFLGFVSLGLILLGASGVYLWFKLYKERRIGTVLLVANLVFSLTLIILIRMA